MDFHADAFFAIGKTHTICQDYARAGETEDDHAYGVVCDGCSSSPDTDFGARLLATAAAFQMKWICRNEGSFVIRDSQILSAASNAANEIDVDMRCLDSTVIAVYQSEENGEPGVRVSLRGDGVVVARERDGSFGIQIFEHEHNAPRYLSYELEPDRFDGYMAKFGDLSRMRAYVSNEGWVEDATVEFQGHPQDMFYSAKTYDLVMVLSDGVQTFQRSMRTGTTKTLDPVPVEQVIEHLLKIKSPTGKFLQRRCHKFLTKYCAINEWQHNDDFGAAAIWMGGA